MCLRCHKGPHRINECSEAAPTSRGPASKDAEERQVISDPFRRATRDGPTCILLYLSCLCITILCLIWCLILSLLPVDSFQEANLVDRKYVYLPDLQAMESFSSPPQEVWLKQVVSPVKVDALAEALYAYLEVCSLHHKWLYSGF